MRAAGATRPPERPRGARPPLAAAGRGGGTEGVRTPADPSLVVRVLRSGDAPVLDAVAPGVFDRAVRRAGARAFLADPRHHLAVAVEGGTVVGFASGVHYVHPDKPVPEMFVNEVGVARARRGRGIGRAVLGALLDEARRLGCRGAWVLTERDNPAAIRLYAALGGEPARRDPVMFSFRTARAAGTRSVRRARRAGRTSASTPRRRRRRGR